MEQYITLKMEHLTQMEKEQLPEICQKLLVKGTEVFMDDICPRSELLYYSEEEKKNLASQLEALCVKRLHCSYWAYPTAFLTKNNFEQLVERFGREEAVLNYYGDLTGRHMFERWSQEYEMASVLKVQSYTFHLIDYAPIDGMWKFTVSSEDIRQAMVFLLQEFINLLMERNLISEETPQIEIENAGFGLEYGIQTAEDYAFLFSQLYDPYHKVKIGWDLNHLLHALGWKKEKKAACFFLPEREITTAMRRIEAAYGKDKSEFAVQWLEHNLLAKETVAKIGSVHLSDCALKTTEFFTYGKLNSPYYENIVKLKTWEEKEEYGVKIVLEHYDSHAILGQGILNPADVKKMFLEVQHAAPSAVLLHELKNCKCITEAVTQQVQALLYG